LQDELTKLGIHGLSLECYGVILGMFVYRLERELHLCTIFYDDITLTLVLHGDV